MNDGHRADRKLIIGYEPTPQGDDAVALGEQLAGALAARPEIRTVVAPRRAGETLARLAESEGAGLVVIGSTHRGPIGRVLLGTTGDELIHWSPAAVAVAPRGFGEREDSKLLRIGVAYDGSAESEHALEAGIGLAEMLHTSLTVVAVAEPRRVGYATTTGILLTPDFELDTRKRTAVTVDRALRQVPDGLPVTSRVVPGFAAERLIESSGDFDLLVMGSRASGTLWRTALGSVSSAVARGSECPLLVIPRGALPDPLGLVGAGAEQPG